MKPAAFGQPFTWKGRDFVRGEVPEGVNRGKPFTLAQPLAGRYRLVSFFASGGMGLLLEGEDLRTSARVLVKAILHYDVVPYARVRDQEGFTNQLRLPRKTLEMERRILVQLRNAGCNAVPYPNDFVYDANPQLASPFITEDKGEWTYDDEEMLHHEPYLVMEAVAGRSLEEVLRDAPGKRLSETRSLRIMMQVAEVLQVLHQPKPMRPGMTWQLVYQDLKPANLLISALDRVIVVDLGGCQLINLDTNQKLLPGAATAGYCPPECEEPYTLLTPAADVYTVGSNLFQLLTGKSPVEFLGSSLAKHQPRAVHLDTRLLEDKCRPEMRAVIERCLNRDPAQRFPDAQSLRQALMALLVAN
ncbi:MAG: protein kinase [Gemmataceae bacterium]|nr:protein kinase [Gemmataceae bacterium]MCI0741399.1 protein kinase [Gemmataceae bacterium]